MFNCNIFKVERSDLFGRYLTATRDIKPGEVILKETPLFVGPQINAILLCFNCASLLIDPYERRNCSICQVAPICLKCHRNVCATCRNSKEICEACKKNYHLAHTVQECQVLKQFPAIDFGENPQIILPVRCLLLRIYDEEKFKRFAELESHEIHRRDTYIWGLHEKSVVEKIRLLSIDENLIQKVCGILDVNSFEVRNPRAHHDPRASLRGIYLDAALMSHDCDPNVHLSVDDHFTMTISAKKFINANETISFNYSNGLQTTAERKFHLFQGKYFNCTCKRCADPTELGTNLSGILCPKCKSGIVNNSAPLEKPYAAKWICDTCKGSFSGALIKTTVEFAREKLEDFLAFNRTPENGLKLLAKLLLTLSPQHSVIVELKQNLISLLSEDPCLLNVRKKVEFCEDILKVLTRLECGISRLTGIAMYELYKSRTELANEAYNAEVLTTDGFLEKLIENEIILKDSLKCLLYEPRNSPEGKLAQRGLNDLRILKGTVTDLKRILKKIK